MSMEGGDPVRLEVLRNNCVFAYIPELETVWGAISLLTGESAHTLCTQVYGQEQIRTWKRKYNFLFETFQILEKIPAMCMMDFILDMQLDGFTLEGFRDALLALPPEDFVWRQLDLERSPKADRKVLQKALTEDEALDEVYSWISDGCSSFLAFSAICRQSKRFITEFFALAEEMRTDRLKKVLQEQEPKMQRMYKMVCEGAQGGDLLEFSQKIMGKTFHNRGPYAQFVFIPSYLIPAKACRYFDIEGENKRQILFLTLRQTDRSREDTIRTLKAIADPTRYQILTLLAREGPLRGLEIAKKVSVATSTVSHHMEQMKESGLITEEPVKNSKYYGLSKNAAKALLEDIAKDFQIE